MLTNQQRKNIIRAAKKKNSWCDNEDAQDKLIEAECVKRGYKLTHFYAEDGNVLNKLLK